MGLEHRCKESKAHHHPEPVQVGACPHSPSQTGQHCPRILPGYLQGAGGQGRGSHWTLPFCQQGPVSREQTLKPGPPYQAAILTVQRQLEQGSWEPTGSPLLCSRPFRKQPVGKLSSDALWGKLTAPVQPILDNSCWASHQHFWPLWGLCSTPNSPSHTGQQVPGRGLAGYGHRLAHSFWRHWMWPSWQGKAKERPPRFRQETEMASESQSSALCMCLQDEMHSPPPHSYAEAE